jgi:hypothetical protein
MHIVAILVVLAIVGYLILHRSAPAKPVRCSWVPDKMQPHQSMVRWVCGTCGEFGYSNEFDPPEQCKRYLKRGL